jgi:hypothetical protein
LRAVARPRLKICGSSVALTTCSLLARTTGGRSCNVSYEKRRLGSSYHSSRERNKFDHRAQESTVRARDSIAPRCNANHHKFSWARAGCMLKMVARTKSIETEPVRTLVPKTVTVDPQCDRNESGPLRSSHAPSIATQSASTNAALAEGCSRRWTYRTAKMKQRFRARRPDSGMSRRIISTSYSEKSKRQNAPSRLKHAPMLQPPLDLVREMKTPERPFQAQA